MAPCLLVVCGSLLLIRKQEKFMITEDSLQSKYSWTEIIPYIYSHLFLLKIWLQGMYQCFRKPKKKEKTKKQTNKYTFHSMYILEYMEFSTVYF